MGSQGMSKCSGQGLPTSDAGDGECGATGRVKWIVFKFDEVDMYGNYFLCFLRNWENIQKREYKIKMRSAESFSLSP